MEIRNQSTTNNFAKLIRNTSSTKPIQNTQSSCDNELSSNIRKAIINKLDAINTYEMYASQTTNTLAKTVFLNIAKDERVNLGKLWALLITVCPNEKTFFEKGNEEVLKMQ